MMWLVGQLLVLPSRMLLLGLNGLLRTAQEAQDAYGRTLEAASTPDAGPRSEERATVEKYNATKIEEKENISMSDLDLSGDDLKIVEYSIYFTKRDLEATLEESTEDVVNYSTDGGSYAARKISRFWKRVAEGKIVRPLVWREENYPENAPDTHWELPEDDDKYIGFEYRVRKRIPKNESEYDKDQVKVLRQIRSSIDRMGERIGGKI